MDIVIRKLTPDLAEDYVRFFDETPHDDGADDAKCYCVCWCNDDYAGKDFSSREKRRAAALDYVRGGNIQGYLAYHGDKIVGWCNANTKSDCLKCCSWRRFMDEVPTREPEKIKSIFCFTVAPEAKRQGVATRLLDHVCREAAKDGFDFVEVYPVKKHRDENINHTGPIGLYEKNGFAVHCETSDKRVLRKALK